MESDDELSWEEKNRLYGMAAVPCFVVFFVLAWYFLFYLVNNNIVAATISNLFIYAILPGSLIGGPSTFLAFEVLHHRKIKQPIKLRAKRFSGRTLATILAVLSFCGLLALADILLSPIIGERYALIIGYLISLLGMLVVAKNFRRFVSKLDKGEW